MLANSDVRGNIKPPDIRLAINDTVNEIYENYFPEINRHVNRQNRGLAGSGLENLPDIFREKLQHFLTEEVELTFDEPYWLLPEDHRYTDIVTADGADVEFYANNTDFRLVSNYIDTAPTATSPIGLKTGNKIKVAPSSEDSVVKISYLRNPVIANWTFNMVNNSEMFNPDANDFRDIDLHVSEENNVILKTMFRLGINLKEQDIIAVTQNKGAQEFNQDNAV